MMCSILLLLASATTALNVPTPHKTTSSMKQPDVSPAVTSISKFMDDEALSQPPARPALAHQTVMAMQEEIVALAIACACVICFPSPASAAQASDAVLSASPDLVILLLAGIAITYTGTIVNAITSSVEAINEMVAPALKGTTLSASVPLPTYKDWLAGQALPAIEELADTCVLIASGANGQWVMCSAPKNADCEPDDTFSAYYGQPIYICPM